MGTISDKLLYLNETKDELRDGINDLVRASDEIDEDDTFRSYVEPLKSIRDRLPKVEGEGENITLDDTIEARMRKTLKGNTSQVQYSGKNLLEQNRTTTTVNGVTFTINDDKTVKCTNQATSDANLDIGRNIGNTFKAGTYIASGCPENGSSSTFSVSIYKVVNETATRITTLYGKNTDIPTFTLDEECEVFYRIAIANGYNPNGIVFEPMIRLSSITDDTYEPYCGGTPSPNPDYPQDIHSVSGDNEIEVCGKNYLRPLTNEEKNSVSISQNGCEITVNGTSSASTTFTKTRYTLKAGTYKLSKRYVSGSVSATMQYIIKNIAKDVNIGGIQLTTSNYQNDGTQTITLTEDTLVDAYVYIGSADRTFTNIKFNIQLVKGDSFDFNFEPYKGNTYPITLPNGIELCKIGNYQDKLYYVPSLDKAYKHKEIGKVVLDGSETYTLVWYETDAKRYAVRTDLDNAYNVNDDYVLVPAYCNYYKAYPQITMYRPYTHEDFIRYGVCVRKNYSQLIIKNNDIGEASSSSSNLVNNFKTWIGNHNLTFYYILSTPIEEEITDTTLLSQLEAVWYSQDGQTNISQENNDQPFWLEVDALKDSDLFH